ncbi:MAG: 30S ribosomal protein S17e [Candidatus Aenigmarchaeota archaeon]|nr:30S ribosomal protein S17e [Candidatus Aenigmarchaeota archaeon]
MGRVRSKLVKNVSKNLIKKYPDELSRDFDKNKEFLREMIESKKNRNKIAGYVTTLKR